MNNSIAFKLAQLPQNVLFVGMDPHKRQHTVSISNAQAQVLSQFKIPTTRSGFEDLLQRVDQVRRQQGAAGVLFGIEPGGHYWRTLAAFLTAHEQTWRLVNPFTLRRQRDGEDLTRRKNDPRDATMAGQLVREGKYTWTTLPTGHYAELRRAHETYQQLVVEVSRAKLQLTTALDQLFPEFQTVFKQVQGSTALTLLRTGANPAQIAKLTVDEFAEQIRAAHAQSGQRWCQHRKVRGLHALAAQSIGLRDEAAVLTQQVKLIAERLAFLMAQLRQAEQDLIRGLEQCEEGRYLLSIFGLGPVNAAGLLAHIGDIRRFSSVKQLPKLAGVHPIENSSAGRAAGRTPMSKKGRAGLRMVAFRSVIGLLRHNPAFQHYVDGLHKRAQHPLKKREAIGAAMNKLLRVVYALLTKRELFDARKARMV